MGYSKRIDALCALLTKTDVFADVGCDHGYCTEYMLKNGLCEHAIFSDISKGSLAKAEKRLRPFVEAGVATPVLGNGFYGVPKTVGEVLIAGMGGSEIVGILSDKNHGFLPKRFVFQPMHDSEKLRKYILDNGGYIHRDFTFRDDKFYDVLVGGIDAETQTEPYTQAELEFGRENLRSRPKAFLERTEKQLKNIEKYLKIPALQEQSRADLLARKQKLRGVLDGETL